MNPIKNIQNVVCTYTQRVNLLGKRTEAYVKIPDNYKYPLATSQATKYQKETNTGGLVKLLMLKVGS